MSMILEAASGFGMMYPVYILPAFFVLLPIYLNAERQKNFESATTLKLILSTLCTISAFLGFLYTLLALEVFFVPQLLVFLALFAAIFGDYYLQFIRLDAKKFNRGIFCFAITQVFLIAMLILQNGILWIEFVITVVVLLLVLLLMKKQKWELGQAEKPLTIYTILLVFMASKAVTALILGNRSAPDILLAAGGVLFLLSDLFLGIWNYRTDKRAHANLNWITYFVGIMLISLSNCYLFY